MGETKKNYWSGAGMVLLAAFLFALKGTLIKMAYQFGADTISILALRMLSAMPFYMAVLWWKNHKTGEPIKNISGKTWLQILALGFIGYYLSAYLNFYGLHFITASLERVVLFIYPTFVLFLNQIFFKKKITGLQFLALGITYAGILIAYFNNIGQSAQLNLPLGVGLVALSGLTYAFYMVGSDRLIVDLGVWVFTSLSMLAATVMMLIHAYFQNGLAINHLRSEVYWIGIGMGIFSTVIPTFLYSAGIKIIGSSNTSIIGSIGPIFTIILASVFLGETISSIQIMGTLLVLIGVFLIGFKGKNN